MHHMEDVAYRAAKGIWRLPGENTFSNVGRTQQGLPHTAPAPQHHNEQVNVPRDLNPSEGGNVGDNAYHIAPDGDYYRELSFTQL